MSPFRIKRTVFHIYILLNPMLKKKQKKHEVFSDALSYIGVDRVNRRPSRRVSRFTSKGTSQDVMFSRYLNTHFTKLGLGAPNALLKATEHSLFARERGSSPPLAAELAVPRDFHVQDGGLCAVWCRAGATGCGSLHGES